MASDRGTLQRGGDQQAPWSGPTAPSSRRLPTAPRERKPALAVLAVLLIVGGALAAGLLVVRSGQKVGAIMITQNVTTGENIPMSAMTEVMIDGNSGESFVPWHYASQVSGFFADEPIGKDTLLNSAMLKSTNPLQVGPASTDVGLALKDGQLPDGLQIGDTVTIYSTQASTGSSGCPGKPGSVLAGSATVISVNGGSVGTGTTDVEVAIAGGAIGSIVCNTANGTAAIAITRGAGGG